MIEIVYFLPFSFVQSLVTELDEGPKARSAELLRWVLYSSSKCGCDWIHSPETTSSMALGKN